MIVRIDSDVEISTLTNLCENGGIKRVVLHCTKYNFAPTRLRNAFLTFKMLYFVLRVNN